mgnify:CR=1 FL=1
MNEKDLKQAFSHIMKQTSYKIPETEEIKRVLEFSEEFAKKKVWNYDKKFFYINRRAYSKVAVILLIIISMAMTSITVYAIYRIFEQKRNKENTDISSVIQELEQNKIDAVYHIEGLPGNYELIEENKNQDSVFKLYSDGEHVVYFSQLLLSGESSIDNEETMQENVIVNDIEGIYYKRDNLATVLFYHDGYLFSISTEIFSKEEIVAMAESIITQEGEEDE